MTIYAIDADSDVSSALDDIISEGYVAVGRYYSSNAHKRLGAAEAAAISGAGLKIFTVFEDGAAPALNYNSGAHDAQIALRQALAVKQPAGSAIYFALDSELGNRDIAGVRDYFRGIKDTIAGHYKLGIYGDGLVCKVLLGDGTCDCAWLSASRGFPGSRTFYRGNQWALAQDPNINQGFHGLSIDLNEVNGDFGGFQVVAQAASAGQAAAIAPRGPSPDFHRPSLLRASNDAVLRAADDVVLQRRCMPYFKRRGTRIMSRAAAAGGPWAVADLCAAYSWPTNLAGGGVIALVELDGGWVQSDMDAYFRSINQPMPQIQDISVDGTKNNPNQHIGDESDPDIEVAMDIQVAAAAYYAATGKAAVIKVYWVGDADPGAIAKAMRAATAAGCDVCSISWGSDEANWVAWGQQAGQDFVTDMEAAAQAATQAGMVVLGSAGDNDSSDGGPNPANVDMPSSCPHVIGCGGTTKTSATEIVWNNNPGQTDGEGTGGGYSTVFLPMPSWQTGAPPPPANLGRMVPDIAANADPNTGYWIFVHGQKMAMGGTSAVAPLYAGLFASFGTKLGFITRKLWANPGCFNDITQGSNGQYDAGPGPDPCTGLGTPIGTKLAALFGLAAAVRAQPQAGPGAAVAPGWSGTITYTYVNGVLVGAPLVTMRGAAAAALAAGVVPAPAPAPSFTVKQGHRYSCTIVLGGLEQLASNDLIAEKFEGYGFQNVTVTGSGATRQGQGTWTGPDTTGQIDPHITNVVDLGVA
jgi:kumamolisin